MSALDKKLNSTTRSVKTSRKRKDGTNYLKVVPEKRFKDKNKHVFDINEEIFNHMREKSTENKVKLLTLYEKSPLQEFSEDKGKIKTLMQDDITHPVGYVPPKSLYQDLMIKHGKATQSPT